jgi:hypothetical protein
MSRDSSTRPVRRGPTGRHPFGLSTPASSTLAPGFLAAPALRPRRDLAPIQSRPPNVLGYRSREPVLVGDLVGALLAHSEELGDLDRLSAARHEQETNNGSQVGAEGSPRRRIICPSDPRSL